MLSARDIGRSLGINRVIARIREKGYETNYDSQLSSCMRAGDVVWDIGANVGYYTRRYAERIGQKGRVIAFEPSARNFERLRRACKELSNVSLMSYGLGNMRAKVHFRQGDDPLGATSQIVDEGVAGDIVEIRVGDDLIADGAIPPPNIVKMDVEGFEGEVIQGLTRTLSASELRAVGMEVHFGILKERGLAHMPRDIENALKSNGFTIVWPDHSHLLAMR